VVLRRSGRMVVQSRNLIVAVSLSAAVRVTTGSTNTLQVTGDAITEMWWYF